MTRFLFALRQGWLYRREIKQFALTSKIPNVTQLELSYLIAKKIKVLALDFDGVLASHGQVQPDEEVVTWLNALSGTSIKLALLSNKPNQARRQYFQTAFPELLFIAGFPKKPYPQGLLAIAQHFKVPPQEVLLADDRLLTGVLASCLAGTQVAYVCPARQNFKARWLEESFFEAVRCLERWMMMGR